MPSAAPDEAVTDLLLAWSNGDTAAIEKLIPVVYAELRRRARYYMRREQSGHTLESAALVNEVYERLVDTPKVQWQDRAHFFAVCANLMRRILVDHARVKGSQKRGAGAHLVSLDEALVVSSYSSPDLLDIDRALSALTDLDERLGRVVELRFFGGLTVAETAEALRISAETVHRDWKVAKAWLMRELAAHHACGA
jgi:RNA polymerase sigma factor (TIGR02999 family)